MVNTHTHTHCYDQCNEYSKAYVYTAGPAAPDVLSDGPEVGHLNDSRPAIWSLE